MRSRSARTRCTARTRRRPPRSKSRSSSPATKSSADRLGRRQAIAARNGCSAGGHTPVNRLLQMLDPASISAFFTQFQAEMQQPAFWVALGKIMWINILLSGDNALVIAMACRGLPPRQRFWGMVLGAGVAVLLRIIFTGIVVTLMGLPFLKLVGGLALLVIAAKLLVPEHEGEGGVDAAAHLWAAVQIVAIADIVMSLDNV